jgi:hypothetical protein
VAVDRLEHELHAIEERIERRLVAREMRADQLLIRGLIAILGTPELRDLLHPALQARALRFSILCDELRFELLHRFIHPDWLLLRGCTHCDCEYRRHEKSRQGESPFARILVWSATAAAAAFACSCLAVTYQSGSCGCRTPNYLFFVRCVASAVHGSSGHGCFG